MLRTRFLIVALATTVAAGALHAQIGLGSMANQAAIAVKNFDIADKNHDGLLTKQEAEKGPVPFIRAHFDQIDKNHRGTVSKQDVVDYVQSLQGKKPATAAEPAAATAPAAASSTH